uniref:Uncharacterized protein n=1 Tax=Anguilla anguilla TaxID=7936 RepID=A0A0E9SVN0_ANGAN
MVLTINLAVQLYVRWGNLLDLSGWGTEEETCLIVKTGLKILYSTPLKRRQASPPYASNVSECHLVDSC